MIMKKIAFLTTLFMLMTSMTISVSAFGFWGGGLSDDQRSQIEDLRDELREDMSDLRDQLWDTDDDDERDALRDEMRDLMDQFRSDMKDILD